LAGKDKWEKLEGSFAVDVAPKRAVFYLEGPPPGGDLLIDYVKISCPPSQLPVIFLFPVLGIFQMFNFHVFYFTALILPFFIQLKGGNINSSQH
jgi:hypothetical protein